MKRKISFHRTEQFLQSPKVIEKVTEVKNKIEKELCSDLPIAFWDRKKYLVDLFYKKDFDDGQIPTKARSIQMSADLEQHCKIEIMDLIKKGLISKSRSLWSCVVFYVIKNVELERGTPRLVINYKPLDRALKWIRYPFLIKKIF